MFARFAERNFSQPARVSTFISGPLKPRAEQLWHTSVSGHTSDSGKERKRMAIADSRALLADIMDIVDEHVTAKASKELEKRILDVLDGYEIATMIRDVSGDADNFQQLIDAFISAKTAEGLAKSSLYLYRYRLVRMHEDTGIPIKKMTADHIKDYVACEIDRGISKTTIKDMERLIWQFFRWLRDEELIRQNPTKNIKIVKAPYEQREAFSQTEVHIIKEA
jgi:hypothetical protein